MGDKVDKEIEALRKEMASVKGLLMLLLTKLGATSDEIALATGVSPSLVRTLMPSRRIKKLPLANSDRV